MASGGRPSKYKKEFNAQAKKLCLLGATDADLADFFEVTVPTITNWKNQHDGFLASLKEAKDESDAKVVKSLFQRALGYSCPEDKIFNNNGKAMVVKTIKHHPPDTTAAIFWLKNRQSAEWRDKQDIDLSGSFSVTIQGDDADL